MHAGSPVGSRPRYLLFRAVFRLEVLLRDLLAVFLDLAAVFFFVVAFFAVDFLAAPLRAAFLAAGAWRLRAAALRGDLAGIMGSLRSAGTRAGTSVLGVCVSTERSVSPTIVVTMTGSLIASSHPGVNISSRSREMAFARPQRGQCAS